MKTIEVVTEIAAPVETVWAELTAVTEYAAWNPFITTFRGDLVEGAKVEVQILPPGGKAMTFRPTITKVEENQHLEWIGRLLIPGVFDGRHSFHLEDLGDGRTRLTQSEKFSGVLVAVTGKTLANTRTASRR